VQAKFTVKDVKTTRQPELTDELLENFGVKTEGALSELVKSLLERRLEYTQRQVARQHVLEQIAASATWELPKDMLMKQARKTLARRVMEMRNSGMSDEQIAGRRRILEQDVLANTAAALKEHFVLQKVAEMEKLEIEDEDLDAEIERMADQSGESARKVRARMEKEELMEALATDLLERKALDLILANATYEDYEANPDDHAGEVSTVSGSAVSEEESKAEAPAAPPENAGS
jgi:trigger factor